MKSNLGFIVDLVLASLVLIFIGAPFLKLLVSAPIIAIGLAVIGIYFFAK
jgi:hypothetical protein